MNTYTTSEVAEIVGIHPNTGACYAVAPFVGALMSFVLLRESLDGMYLVAFAVMLVGTALVVSDTLNKDNT